MERGRLRIQWLLAEASAYFRCQSGWLVGSGVLLLLFMGAAIAPLIAIFAFAMSTAGRVGGSEMLQTLVNVVIGTIWFMFGSLLVGPMIIGYCASTLDVVDEAKLDANRLLAGFGRWIQSALVSVVLAMMLAIAVSVVYLSFAAFQEIDVGFWPVFLLVLVLWVVVVPLAVSRFIWALFLVTDRRLDAIEALIMSQRLPKGRMVPVVFCLVFVWLLLLLSLNIFCFLALIVTVPGAAILLAVVYRNLLPVGAPLPGEELPEEWLAWQADNPPQDTKPEC